MRQHHMTDEINNKGYLKSFIAQKYTKGSNTERRKALMRIPCAWSYTESQRAGTVLWSPHREVQRKEILMRSVLNLWQFIDPFLLT